MCFIAFLFLLLFIIIINLIIIIEMKDLNIEYLY